MARVKKVSQVKPDLSDDTTFIEVLCDFTDGPEHNAYYDLLEKVLPAMLDYLTPGEREEIIEKLQELEEKIGHTSK